MGLEISIKEKEPGIFIISPQGEINTDTHQKLEKLAQEIIFKAKGIILDMSKVSYISSLGLSGIFRIKLAIEEKQGTIALINMQPQIQQVFETMKILSPQVFASLQEADDYLDKFLDGVQKGTIKPRENRI